jgi:ABC-type multidrug transport system fused ATPase/permease subunit
LLSFAKVCSAILPTTATQLAAAVPPGAATHLEHAPGSSRRHGQDVSSGCDCISWASRCCSQQRTLAAIIIIVVIVVIMTVIMVIMTIIIIIIIVVIVIILPSRMTIAAAAVAAGVLSTRHVQREAVE